MRTSLSSFLYYNYSLEEAIQRTSVAGFDAIDIWGGRPHAYRDDLREHHIRSIRALVDDLGLEFASFIPAQFQYPTSLCSPIKNIRQDSIDYIKSSIETAARLGASVVSLSPGHTLSDQSQDEGWELLADSLTQLCDFSGNYDVLLALEPSDVFETDLINTTLQALDMIDQIGCDNLGVVFDTGHALIAGEDTPTALENLGDRLFHLHLSDNDGTRDQHLIPGKGIFNFEELIRTLKNKQFEGFLTAEPGWDYTLHPDPAAVETQDYLFQLIND